MSKRIQRSFSGGEISPFVYPLTGIQKRAQGLATAKNVIIKKFGAVENRVGTEIVLSLVSLGSEFRMFSFTDSRGNDYLLAFFNGSLGIVGSDGKLEAQLETNLSLEVLKRATFTQQADRLIVTSNYSIPMELVRTDGPLSPRTLTGIAAATVQRLGRNLKTVEGMTSHWTFREVFSGAPASAGTAPTITTAIPADPSFIYNFRVTTVYKSGAESLPLSVSQGTVRRPNPSDRYQVAWGINPALEDQVDYFNVYVSVGTSAGPYYLLYTTQGATDRSFNYIGEPADPTVALAIGEDPFLKNAIEASIDTSVSTALVVQGDALSTDAVYVATPSPSLVFGDTLLGSGVVKVDRRAGKEYLVDFFSKEDLPVTTRSLVLTDVGDYPRAAAFYGQRLFLAASLRNPETIWASKLGLYNEFRVPRMLADNSPYSFSLASSKFSRIAHLTPLRELLALTGSGEWTLGQETTATGITPSPQSQYGSSDITPEVVENSVVFAQGPRVLRDYGYREDVGGYSGNDLTTFSSHFFEGKTITSMAFQKLDDPIFWVTLDDGSFLSLTYFREQSIFAWAKHETDGFVEQIETTNQPSRSDVYLLVRRRGQRVLEKMAQVDRTDKSTFVFMDSAVKGKNTDTLRLLHLVGKEVSIYTNEGVIARQTVPEGGTLRFKKTYEFVVAGLPYESDVETLPLDLRGQDTITGEALLVNKIILYLSNTFGLKVGSSAEDLLPIKTRIATGLEPRERLTDQVISGRWGKNGEVFIRQSDPLPFTINGIVMTGNFSPGDGRVRA